MSKSPARRFARFFNGVKSENILDFGLEQTALHDGKEIAKWLGIDRCLLKLETSHPTGTFKDRITELAYSFFDQEGISEYVHCSTGNTGTSLVWGLQRYPKPFRLTVFISEDQLAYHNFDVVEGLTVKLLQGANYQQAKKYANWYARTFLKQSEYLGFNSPVRQDGNKLAYLEALEQCKELSITPDIICQTISDGSGINGAALAVENLQSESWYILQPKICAFQPEVANPMVRAFKAGSAHYNPSYNIEHLLPSRAHFIRRTDAAGSYERIYDIVTKSGGFIEDANETKIREAKDALTECEGIDAGYTACVALAGLKKRTLLDHTLSKATALVMITGRDRATEITPSVIDEYISPQKWKAAIAE